MLLKSFKLNASSLRRLVELAQSKSKEWGHVEMSSDDELRDEELRTRMLALAARVAESEKKTETSSSSLDLDAGLEANLVAIKKRIHGSPSAVIPMKRPNRTARFWYTGGLAMAAAAAVVLFISMPGPMTGDREQMGVKGPGAAGVSVISCDVEPRSSAASLLPARNGTGFIVPPGESVTFAFRCTAGAYVHATVVSQSDNSIEREVRNYRVEVGQKVVLGAEPPFAVTAASKTVIVRFVATEAQLQGDAPVPADGDTILWTDEVTLIF